MQRLLLAIDRLGTPAGRWLGGLGRDALEHETVLLHATITHGINLNVCHDIP
jgi:hypothetical protein